uniref:Putative secreted protein n=1 Tax=Ixodes ricinus TaxID=34613 RepID=A0A6B0U2C2_IXORI
MLITWVQTSKPLLAVSLSRKASAAPEVQKNGKRKYRPQAHYWQVAYDVKSDEHRRQRNAQEARRRKAVMFARCMSKQKTDCRTSTFT